MTAIVQCVPNFSEGRRIEVIEAIVRAIRGVDGVQVLNVDSDHSHNRTVVTFIGPPTVVVEAAFRAIAVACNRIDMEEHRGEHPRIGAADVVPIIPVRDITLNECAKLAQELGRRVADDLDQPVYLYEAAATHPDRTNLADIRRGEYEGWKAEVGENPDRAPDFGPAAPKTSGATIIGARPFLIAFNVYLNTDDVGAARRIATAVRHSSGGLRFVQALGLLVDGRAQVSMNLTDFERTPLHRVVELIRIEAGRQGLMITHAELVGLIPETALIESARWYLQLRNLPADQILETHLDAIDLDRGSAHSEYLAHLEPFLDAVASGTAAPGGGSAAALAATLGAGLGAMVARLTAGREQYAEVEDRILELAGELDEHRQALAEAVESDADAYRAVMSAYRLPKSDDKAKQERLETIEQATVQAGQVPLQMAQRALRVLHFLSELVEIGNINAVTDAGCGAYLAAAAIRSAALNVQINSQGLQNQDLAAEWTGQIRSLLDRTTELERRIHRRVVERAGLE